MRPLNLGKEGPNQAQGRLEQGFVEGINSIEQINTPTMDLA
jgi:hypothetical protein